MRADLGNFRRGWASGDEIFFDSSSAATKSLLNGKLSSAEVTTQPAQGLEGKLVADQPPIE